MADASDAFYVGYLPLPNKYRPVVWAFLALWIGGMLTMAALLATGQQDPGPGQWDLSESFELEGHLSVDPYAMLYVEDSISSAGVRSVLLVSDIKAGAVERAAPLAGQRVRARGHFIDYRGRTMFELVGGAEALTAVGDSAGAPTPEPLGTHTLTGEIVDSKCFLGVMKPGFGKTHRACAVRCIDGGIPPVFVTRDESGAPTFYLLTDESSAAVNEQVLPYIAETVELSGRLERRGDLLVYAIDPNQIERK